MTSRPLDKYEQDLIANVEKHGWQATYVFDPDGNDPGFTYTIGFPTSINAPDFIIFGLSQELMHDMLWEIYRQLESGREVEDEMAWQGLLEGDYVCVSRKVHPDNYHTNYFNSARWYLKHVGLLDDTLAFHQLFWPGVHDKKLPYEPGAHPDVINAQPLLFEPGHDY